MVRKGSGFSLIELIVVLCLVTVLSVMTMSFLKSVMVGNRIASDVNVLVSSLYLARSEALKRNEAVTLCRSPDGVRCSGAWEEGWMVFVDRDGDKELDSGSDVLLLRSPALRSGDTLRFNNSSNSVRFDPLGATTNAGTFRVCDGTGDPRYARGVIVSFSGRPRLSTDMNGDGVHESASGVALSCP